MTSEYKSVNQLIVIGNGFDLHCNLSSRFTDYFKKLSESVSKIKDNFFKDIDLGNGADGVPPKYNKLFTAKHILLNFNCHIHN